MTTTPEQRAEWAQLKADRALFLSALPYVLRPLSGGGHSVWIAGGTDSHVGDVPPGLTTAEVHALAMLAVWARLDADEKRDREHVARVEAALAEAIEQRRIDQGVLDQWQRTIGARLGIGERPCLDDVVEALARVEGDLAGAWEERERTRQWTRDLDKACAQRDAETEVLRAALARVEGERDKWRRFADTAHDSLAPFAAEHDGEGDDLDDRCRRATRAFLDLRHTELLVRLYRRNLTRADTGDGSTRSGDKMPPAIALVSTALSQTLNHSDDAENFLAWSWVEEDGRGYRVRVSRGEALEPESLATKLTEERDTARAESARLRDLVRYQRGELFDAGLLTREEYAALAGDHGAVARLESYDEVRAESARLTRELAEARATIENERGAGEPPSPGWVHRPPFGSLPHSWVHANRHLAIYHHPGNTEGCQWAGGFIRGDDILFRGSTAREAMRNAPDDLALAGGGS